MDRGEQVAVHGPGPVAYHRPDGIAIEASVRTGGNFVLCSCRKPSDISAGAWESKYKVMPFGRQNLRSAPVKGQALTEAGSTAERPLHVRSPLVESPIHLLVGRKDKRDANSDREELAPAMIEKAESCG